ncbi:helix-turn-helix transcriptional regulator [Candidatus Methylospira mobilis]|uniref:Helix-turn-helix transcriptional regulator n=2 Tax=Candidatus Methylospira mobilis TaxID=1808979 RepID=A0A5Q0BRQ4_9GAMM|nr:helix-turn-helix transcriptional regulator [Candidatus Methylospira mobilis]QFY44941.1 helix-turn-helix transcriptional regulator [Candidatus Methylospira mobilis]WNV03009.1 helix-turn-helix transcriptional regulator [Candidatus Methylospira mobilis]
MREARNRLGMPQDRLGVLIGLDEGCSSARISRYETGVHEPPFDVAKKIARMLEVPVAYLFCEDDWMADMLLSLDALTVGERAQMSYRLSALLEAKDLPMVAEKRVGK